MRTSEQLITWEVLNDQKHIFIFFFELPFCETKWKEQKQNENQPTYSLDPWSFKRVPVDIFLFWFRSL